MVLYIECPIPLTVPKVCPSCGVKEDMDVYKSGDAKRTALLCLVSTCMNLGENLFGIK